MRMGSEGIEIVDFYEAVSTAGTAHEILTVGCERDGTSHQGPQTADYCISELIPVRSIPIVYLDQPGVNPSLDAPIAMRLPSPLKDID